LVGRPIVKETVPFESVVLVPTATRFLCFPARPSRVTVSPATGLRREWRTPVTASAQPPRPSPPWSARTLELRAWVSFG